jgi:hypothetical protein
MADPTRRQLAAGCGETASSARPPAVGLRRKYDSTCPCPVLQIAEWSVLSGLDHRGVGMSKYSTPEWRKTPIRAQIDEALREVEQVKAALLALKSKATQLDEFHRMRVGYVKNRPKTPDNDMAAQEKAWKPIAKMGEWAQSTATGELSRLDGWMKSLVESELALNTLLSPSGTQGAVNYMVDRSNFLKKQTDSWLQIRWPMLLLDQYGTPGGSG